MNESSYPSISVKCDRCKQTNLKACIGCESNIDYCLRCVDDIIQGNSNIKKQIVDSIGDATTSVPFSEYISEAEYQHKRQQELHVHKKEYWNN